MKLYFHPMSSNARRARMAAIALGINPELVLVDLQKGEQRKPEYMAINPNGKVPTLVDGETVLWESIAIMEYLADKTPGQKLYPTDTAGRANHNKWLFWAASHWNVAIGMLVFENFLKAAFGHGGPNEYAVGNANRMVGDFGGVLDAQLAKSRYIVGETMTLADFAIAAPLMYMGPAKIDVEKYGNLMRWFREIQATDAWKQTEPSHQS